MVCGATATGKTPLSLALAERLGGAEIISADSRQVYRGMDIGTAKVSAADRSRVPHHGIDLVEPPDDFTVADYRGHATAALAAIGSRGNVPILAGGTGLYLRAVARGVPVEETGRDPAIRAELESQLARLGPEPLVAALRSDAPMTAARTDLANPRRVVRALERVRVRGDRPPPPPVGYPSPVLWLGLALEATLHRDRIKARAGGQFQAGLVDEAAALRERYGDAPRSFSAIGYREAFGVLDGRLSVEEAVAIDAQRNWAYARRQRTWFRVEPAVTWLDAGADPFTAAWPLVETFLSRVRAPGSGR